MASSSASFSPAHVYRFPAYDFFVGYHGVTEFAILNSFLETSGFKFRPGGIGEEQTVKVTNFFFLDDQDEFISLESITKENSKIFLHGVVHSWSGSGKTFHIGNVSIKAWLVCLFFCFHADIFNIFCFCFRSEKFCFSELVNIHLENFLFFLVIFMTSFVFQDVFIFECFLFWKYFENMKICVRMCFLLTLLYYSMFFLFFSIWLSSIIWKAFFSFLFEILMFCFLLGEFFFRSFQENEDLDGFNLFVQGEEMHFFLSSAEKFYEPLMEKTILKMVPLHWICKEIVRGPFAYGKDVDPKTVEVYVQKHGTELGLVKQNWCFIENLVKFFVCFQWYSEFWRIEIIFFLNKWNVYVFWNEGLLSIFLYFFCFLESFGRLFCLWIWYYFLE